MKKVKRLVAAVIVLLVALVVGAVFWIDHVAKAGVEVGATYALGVDTTVDSMDVGLLGGSVEMADLNVANPAGFTTPHFLRLGDGRVAVSLGSLTGDKVVVPELTLSGITMNLEKNRGKSNYEVILDNLKRFESKKETAPEPVEDGKRFVINKVAVRDVHVNVNLLPIGGEITRVPVTIERIDIEGVGSDSNKGVLLAELTDIVIQAILKAVVEKAGHVLPADIAGELTAGLSQLEGLRNTSIAVVGEVTTAAGDVVKQVGEVRKQVGESLDKSVKDAGKQVEEGLGGLLGGSKNKDKQDD